MTKSSNVKGLVSAVGAILAAATKGGGGGPGKPSKHSSSKRTPRGSKRKLRKKRKSKRKVKKRSAGKLEISQHNDLSKKYVKCYHKPKYAKLHRSARFKYEVVRQGVLTCTDGTQGVITAPYMFTRPQMNGEVSGGDVRSVYGQWDTDPFLLNPYNLMPTNAVYTGTAPAVQANDRLGIVSVTNEISIVNLESIATEVSCNWYICKKMTSSDPKVWWQECINEEGMTQPNATAVASLTSMTNPTSGKVPDTSTRNFNPSGLKDFKKAWTFIGGEHFVLQPGDQRNLCIKVPMNTIVSKKYLVGSNEVFMAGYTIIPMIIIRPALSAVAIRAGDVILNATEVTYGPGKIGFVSSMKMTFAGLPVQRFNSIRTYQGELVNAGAVSGQVLDHINDVDVKDEIRNA